jgi:hypothetical protein
MLLTLLLDPHFPSDDIIFTGWGLTLAWLVLVGWSIWQLFRAGSGRKRGAVGLGVAMLVLLVGGQFMWGCMFFLLWAFSS